MSVAPLVKTVWRLASAPKWAAPAVVGLALLSAVLEAAGLYLFIPLMKSLGAAGSAAGGADFLLQRIGAFAPPQNLTAILVAGLVLAIVGKNLVNLVGGYVERYVDGVVAHGLRLRVFEQSLSSCIDYRPGSRVTDIAATLSNNTWKVSHALSLVFRLMISSCTLTVFFALMFFISPPLTGVAVVMLGVTALVVHLATRRAEGAGKIVVEENKAFGLRMWEGIGALQLIRSFAREEHEVSRFRHHSETIRRRILQLDFLWALPAPIAEVLGASLIGALILVGVRTGTGLASLAAFLAVLYRLQGPTREIMQCKVALEGLGGAVEDVDVFLEDTRLPYLTSGTKAPPVAAPTIELRDVSFRYAPGEPLALDRVSLTLPAGKTTAFVGRSGAGKSTLMSLIFRFRDPESGQVLADGTPLPELDLSAWRGRLSLMAQEAQLFNDTVAVNIGYGDLHATPEDIRRAAAVAGADDFIQALPAGYDTELGDRGMRLSGGQRQRIALARTILKAPAVLLLDEPTNALDAESELAFQTALETFSHSRTVVVIAHRLSTVRNADQVIVLDGGRVVEAGRPAELLARPGHFARMYGLQTGAPDREIA